MKGVIAAAIVVGSGLASPTARAGDFDLDMCLKRAAGGLNYDLTFMCPRVDWALRFICVAGAYSWYAAEVSSCIAMDGASSQRLQKPLL